MVCSLPDCLLGHHCDLLTLQVHSEIVPILIQFLLPSIQCSINPFLTKQLHIESLLRMGHKVDVLMAEAAKHLQTKNMKNELQLDDTCTLFDIICY